ncbi:sugar-binding domain-containing protein [Galbitalea sp. SE-J8]|uniref:sugar-binding transcriptional regulator n=1 Tax=Galbitalea sp. SE-J8 TaxID=3054952 RepID=UPI00259CFA35|nr:sugar-binding domain-containing protein [Galbitalea sp. SE-J8]MDM4761416.1 sugar-binding domain-containing protein [Galbitalea sp. SE-J8]
MSDDAEPPLPARTSAALRAAQLYYMQDLTMEAIARELGTSRSSVSRLLTFARDTGLVDIRIRSPLEASTALEGQIARRFDVAAHIVPVPDHTSDVDRLARVALSTARMLDRFVDATMTVGIAWGSTMSAISRVLVPLQRPGIRVVQLNGAGNTRTTGVDYASEILRRFGDAFGASIEQFPVPAFFDDRATKTAMWRERSTRRVLDLQRSMDVALFSVGSPLAQVPSHVYMGGYLERSDYDSLGRDRVVGDVATVFFRADGSWRDVELNARASGPGFDVLARVPRRVCVVSGAAKARSLRGALAAGVVTDLVLDEGAARELVAL